MANLAWKQAWKLARKLAWKLAHQLELTTESSEAGDLSPPGGDDPGRPVDFIYIFWTVFPLISAINSRAQTLGKLLFGLEKTERFRIDDFL